MNKITKRQEEILKIIIEEYTNTALPVGSNLIINKYLNSYSSATIRNDMAALEKNNLIIKNYSSSGRIPSAEGYHYYNEYLDGYSINQKIKIKLKDILSKRSFSIDETIEESMRLINDAINLPSVVTKIYDNELLKKIDLVELSEVNALLLIITSSGNLTKKEITIDKELTTMSDVVLCVQIFNERLIDTPLKEIEPKLKVLEKIIREKIKSHEYLIDEIVMKIFNQMSFVKTDVSGSNKLLTQPEYNDLQKIKKIMDLLEDVSIWKQIAATRRKTGKSLLTFKEELGIENLAIASTNININDISREISIVGPERLTNAKAAALLDYLKKELETRFKDEEKNK